MLLLVTLYQQVSFRNYQRPYFQGI